VTESQKHLEQMFTAAGGVFTLPIAEIESKLRSVTAFIFDWDGVFNDGRKGADSSSGFTETDSMGTNLLRFSFWKDRGSLPFIAILSGEENPDAKKLAEREHFHALFQKVKDKSEIFSRLQKDYQIEPKNIAYIFDDVLDLAVAKQCGLRICVKTNASLLLHKFIMQHSLCDYRSGNSGGNNAVRESCELMIGLIGNYDAILEERIAYSETYQKYFSERQKIKVEVF
jgi:3-deoxy-D-manno-octulosonate 8-phosphate phosphatase (KDO 8-P phosphatase)